MGVRIPVEQHQKVVLEQAEYPFLVLYILRKIIGKYEKDLETTR